MENNSFPLAPDRNNSREPNVQHLDTHQIEMIDEALSLIGDYGEVRLIVEKGRLRFLVTQKSFDVLKIQPGMLCKDLK